MSHRKNMAAITLELNSESFSYLVNRLGKPQVVLSYAEAESLALALLTTVEINNKHATWVVGEMQPGTLNIIAQNNNGHSRLALK